MIRATLMTLALAGGTLAAQAPPDFDRRPGPAGREQPGPYPMLRSLGLSKEQEWDVRAVLDRHRATGRALHKAAAEQDEALHGAAEDPAVPDAQLRTLHAAAGEAHLKALLDHRAMLRELDALLTPTQRAKADKLRRDLKREREARRAVAEDLDEPGGMAEDGPPPPPHH